MSAEGGKHPHRRNRDELLVEATVRYWWQRRRFIASTMLVFIVIFAVAVFAIPKSYRAQASVIIMPPRFMPEIRTEPLSVITAQNLLQTNELYQQVKQQLQRYRSILARHAGTGEMNDDVIDTISQLTASELMATGHAAPDEAEAIAQLDPTEVRGLLEFTDEELAELSIDSLADILSSSEAIEKRTASDIVYSPVLQLFAVADTGNKAQVLVNFWAQLFEKKYQSLTQGQTQRLFASLEKQQDAGQEELENVQNVLVQFSLANNLELIQRQIAEHTNNFTSINKLLATKSQEFLTLEAKVHSLDTLLDALEGTELAWIGSVIIEDIESDGPKTRYATASVSDVATTASPVVRRRRAEALKSREDVIAAYEAAASFNAANPIELLDAELQRARDEYLQEKTEYRLNLVQAEVARKTLNELSRTIDETSQAVSLYTALPDEIVGEALAANRLDDVERVASIHLNKEQLNPLWETLVKQRAEVSRTLYEAEASLAELAAALPEKEANLRRMSEQIFQARQAETLVNLRVDREDKMNQQLFTDYSGLKEQVFQLGWEKTMLQDEIDSLETAAAISRETIESLRTSYESASAQQEILELRKKAALQRAELLTEKLQESMVAVREEVSDISLASKAVAPTRHFFPPRSLLLAGLTLLTGGILLGGLSRRRYQELLEA